MKKNNCKRNILFIIPTLDGGGAEKVLVNILNKMDYKKCNVTLILHCKSGIYLKDINKNVKIKHIYNPNYFKYRYFHSIYYRVIMFLYNKFPKLLHKLIAGNRNDVEIAFLEGEPVKFLSNSSNKKSKKIAWIHTDIKSFDRIRLKNSSKYYEKMDDIICVSNDAKKSFDEVYPQYTQKVSVIYNLIDIDNIREICDEDITHKFKKNTIIGIGRLINEKRFDVLIKAHKLLIEDGIENELIILGEGSKRDDLESLIKNLEIERTVKLMGFKSNPYPYIKNADVFALSSDIEGFSLVVCESLVLGKSIVSTNCTGPREILDNGKYGLIYNKGSEFELKENLKKVLLNKNIRKYYENKSIERSKIFNADEAMKEIYKIIG